MPPEVELGALSNRLDWGYDGQEELNTPRFPSMATEQIMVTSTATGSNRKESSLGFGKEVRRAGV